MTDITLPRELVERLIAALDPSDGGSKVLENAVFVALAQQAEVAIPDRSIQAANTSELLRLYATDSVDQLVEYQERYIPSSQSAPSSGLAPCPFCSHTTAPKPWTYREMVGEDYWDDGNADSFAVVCDAEKPDGPGGCGGSGGFFPTEEAAIAAWNRRPAAPAATQPAPHLDICASVDDTMQGHPKCDCGATQPAWPMKDHELRELVNALRDVAVKYHGTQQLRERIAQVVHPWARPTQPAGEEAHPDTVRLDWLLLNSEFNPESTTYFWNSPDERKASGRVEIDAARAAQAGDGNQAKGGA